jgi:Holliday junction resolvase RusA-like endonuclease
VTIRFTILGEPASKANQREIVTFPTKSTHCPRCKHPRTSCDKACAKCGHAFVRPAVIKSKKARTYEHDALRQIPPSARVMLQGPVKVTLRIFYASERPDLDESVVLDVLQARYKGKGPERVMIQRGVYVNDRQVREKHVYHGIDRRNPRTEVEIEPMQAQQETLFEPAPLIVEQKRVPLRELAEKPF